MPSYSQGSEYGNPLDQYGDNADEEQANEFGEQLRGEVLERIEQYAAENPLVEYIENTRSTAQDRPQSVGVECRAMTADGRPLLVRKVSEYRNEGGVWDRYPEGQEQVMIIVEPRRGDRSEEQFERVYVSLRKGWDVWLPERSSDPIARPELSGEGVQTEDGFARRALGAIIREGKRQREPMHVAKSGMESIGDMMKTTELTPR